MASPFLAAYAAAAAPPGPPDELDTIVTDENPGPYLTTFFW